MSKKLEFAVHFANTCKRYDIAPSDLAELIRLTDRAFAAGERYCNSGTEKDSKRGLATGAAVEQHAATMGFATEWPGLYPRFTNTKGEAVHLPQG